MNIGSDISAAVAASTATITERAPHLKPVLGIVLGSGWDGIADLVEDAVDIPYGDLPAFPLLDVQGHAGSLRLGTIAHRPVALLRGRKHAYEHGDPAAMKGAIRTLAAVGCGTLLLTNAAGSLDATMRPGELMLIADHLNLVQRTPLHGESGSERFVDMADAYDAVLRNRALAIAAGEQITLHSGTYAWLLGPQFETPAEIRMLQMLGAQAVGMSTVPETILARHAGLRVLAISMFTNMGCGLEAQALSHAHTLTTAKAGAAQATLLLRALVGQLEF